MNTLPAMLATYLFKSITIEDIRSALATFVPSSAQTPGRLNLFQFRHFKFWSTLRITQRGLSCWAISSKLDGTPKIGIISGTGDRRDDDIRELGRISAKYFDEIIIRCDKNLRGRTADEIVNPLC